MICAIIIGVILFIFGITKSDTKVGGNPENAPVIGKDFMRRVNAAPYSDAWATDKLARNYPVYSIDNTVKTNGLSQRKRLINAVDFLNRIDSPSIVIYANAANGRHVQILADMFPQIEFHLYDNRPFYRGLDGYPGIRLNPFYGGARTADGSTRGRPTASPYGSFTDEVAAYYAKRENCTVLADLNGKRAYRDIYFINDNDEAVQNKKWICAMRPLMSMIRWRPPQPQTGQPAKYRYLAGDMYADRLIVSAKTKVAFPERDYDVATIARNIAWYRNVLCTYDFSDRCMRDFMIDSDKTFREFYMTEGPVIWDSVYELQVLSKCGKPLHIEMINMIC